MKTLNINISRLSTTETVRHSGLIPNGPSGGIYTIHLLHTVPSDDVKAIDIHMSLEALVQLRQRIDAALSHMITH